MIFFTLLFSCTTDTNQAQENKYSAPVQPNQKPPHPQHGSNRKHTNKPPPKGGFLPSTTPAEDLTSSWSANFSKVTVNIIDSSNCPDQDQDGFVSATVCPFSPVNTLDCDDNDPNITPKNEIWIPPGPFIMGSKSSHAGSDEDPVHIVTLSGYCLDRTEVSAKDWFSWLKQSNRKPQGSDLRNTKNNQYDPTRANYPAEGVTWQEASDYCASVGKTLPTEAQWEKAARGGCELGSNPKACDTKDLRPYPWGNEEPTCARANHQLSTQGMPKICVSDTLKVDSLPAGAGPYGHLHLAGNVWEFVLDAWHPNTYQKNRPNDPSGPVKGDIHVLRGGGWNTFSTNMRAANRFHDLVMGSATGFRCARSSENTFDTVAPLEMVSIQGTITGSPTIKGRAIYVTAFDAADADPNGMLAPGRSPVAEIRLTPNGQKTQPFLLSVPKDSSYILSAALDAGTGAQKDEYISASGSGGFGQAQQNPISAPKNQTGITIQLMSAPPMPKP